MRASLAGDDDIRRLWTRDETIDFEQSLLGAILINVDALDRVSDILRPEHFVEPIHGRAYSTLIDAASDWPRSQRKWMIYAIGSLNELRAPAWLSVLSPDDNRGYATSLIVQATTVTNAREFATLIRDAAVERGTVASPIREAA